MNEGKQEEGIVKQSSIFWPTLILVAWTFLVLVQVPIRRFRAAFAGRVTAADFACGESDRVPTDVALPNRLFMNLVEVPVLFYTVSIIGFVTGNVTPALLSLAWLYLGLRLLHSVIYLTYNHVVHRFVVFAASNGVVIAMLMLLGWALAG